MIERRTRGGGLAIETDIVRRAEGTRAPAAMVCMLCDGEKTARQRSGELEDPLVITTSTDAGRADELVLCADCVATALAFALARDHVRRGGSLDDIARPLGEVYGADVEPPRPGPPGRKPDPGAPRRYDRAWGGL